MQSLHLRSRGTTAAIYGALALCFAAQPARSDGTFLLAASGPHKIQVLANGGAAWCSSHLSLTMVVSPDSPDIGNTASLLAVMNRLKTPISVDCRAAVTAELTLEDAGMPVETYLASSTGGWRFSPVSSAPATEQANAATPHQFPSAGGGTLPGASAAVLPQTAAEVDWASLTKICQSKSVTQGMMTVVHESANDPTLKGMKMLTSLMMSTDIQESISSVTSSRASQFNRKTGEIMCQATLARKVSVQNNGNADAAADEAGHRALDRLNSGDYASAQSAESEYRSAQDDATTARVVQGFMQKYKDTPAVSNFVVRRTDHSTYVITGRPPVTGMKIYSTEVAVGQ